MSVEGHLFDPDEFGQGPVFKDRSFTGVSEEPVPWVDPWVVVSTRRGPLPYTHLPIQPEKLEKFRTAGSLDRSSLMTVCGQIGWPISQTSTGMGEMICCPTCLQLS